MIKIGVKYCVKHKLSLHIRNQLPVHSNRPNKINFFSMFSVIDKLLKDLKLQFGLRLFPLRVLGHYATPVPTNSWSNRRHGRSKPIQQNFGGNTLLKLVVNWASNLRFFPWSSSEFSITISWNLCIFSKSEDSTRNQYYDLFKLWKLNQAPLKWLAQSPHETDAGAEHELS